MSFIRKHFFNQVGGLNISDSVFTISESQGTGSSKNYDYQTTGAISKRLGHQLINASPDTQLRTLGLGVRNTVAGAKSLIRAAGTKLQYVDVSAQTFTDLSEDTAAASESFLAAGSTAQVSTLSFNTADAGLLLMAGGGMASPYAVYSDSKVTALGAGEPTGSISTASGGSGGSFAATGTYTYAIALKKASTGASSNAALDDTVTVGATTEQVTITLTGLTSLDTTKYSTILIYRSALSGVSGFTAGDLIAEVPSTSTSYIDDGVTAIEDAVAVPRASSDEDHSTLPAGTYKTLRMFKRRVVTASGNTVRFSSVNQPEYFPTIDVITVPSGGPITGLGVVSFNTPTATSADEFLAVFKENETWVITGDTIDDFALKFIDNVGCLSAETIVHANGYLTWFDRRGVYLWDGSGKPIYASRPIEAYWGRSGEIDRSKLGLVWGSFYKKTNQVIWYLSSSLKGEQKFGLKLDLRLTLPSIHGTIGDRVINGVFSNDTSDIALYSATTYTADTENEEFMIGGDDEGNLYRLYNVHSDAGNAIDFKYETGHLDCGSPAVAKKFNKVIAWVNDLGDWDLTLDYWTDYITGDKKASSRSVKISAKPNETQALWDVAEWDVAKWDDAEITLKPVVFNLGSVSKNNNEGDAIKLRFSQGGVDQPITIHGFTLYYQEMSTRK